MSARELERELKLMQAAWKFFDGVRGRVSAEMQKGPRGGGRDRDHIVRHILLNEQDWARMVGVLAPDDAILTARGLKKHREAYCRAIRDYHAQGKLAGKIAKWPIRFSDSAHRLSHAGSCLGNGRQGPDCQKKMRRPRPRGIWFQHGNCRDLTLYAITRPDFSAVV